MGVGTRNGKGWVEGGAELLAGEKVSITMCASKFETCKRVTNLDPFSLIKTQCHGDKAAKTSFPIPNPDYLFVILRVTNPSVLL